MLVSKLSVPSAPVKVFHSHRDKPALSPVSGMNGS